MLEKHRFLTAHEISAEQKKLNVSPRTEVSKLSVTIHEGRHRQIRRVLATEGIEVLRLQRRSFGPIGLGDLKVGEVEELSEGEVLELKQTTQVNKHG
mmetsp:Transcript_27113/g.42410  ORF Transcript_27113/g.42410 Transcript_27113/m.42410 type:complete len:97 (-) Transcript_27113:76-366(-)